VNLELCLLEKFTATCRDCLELHINQVSSQAVAPFSAEVDDVFDRVRGDKKRVSAFVERLSKVYDDLRSGGTKEKAEAKVGTSFVRKSIKYWVHPDNLTEVKCHVLRHLPIFAFPNKDGSPHNPAITSVYYDNSNLDLYTGRLLKQDEAIALRIRWYGVPEQPVVYVENKIHYEDWTGEPSTKSRFAIAEKDVNAFMAGTRTLDDRIKELTASGAVPRKEIEAMDKLAKQVQKAVK
ncbi:MAG: VTC domain-containing protein, partial [Olpidium bornovanus]